MPHLRCHGTSVFRSSPKYKIRPNLVVFYDKPGIQRICSNPDPHWTIYTAILLIAIPQNMFINSLVKKDIFPKLEVDFDHALRNRGNINHDKN